MKTTPLTRVIATLLALPLAAAPALAEQHTGDDAQAQTEQTEGTQSGTSSEDGSTATDESATGDAQSGEGMDGERLIATVDGTDITAADVQTAIEGLPQQMRQQMPPETLASMAVDQLVLRQLILQEAEGENLAEDPEVQQLIEENQRANEEDAILQIYVQRQLEGAVTDEAVQQTYDQIAAQSEQELPPLEAVRPQIEQQLRQQRLSEVRDDLMEDVEITYYGPDGEPMDVSADGAGEGSDGSSGSSSTEGGSDGSSMDSSDSGSGSSMDSSDTGSDSSMEGDSSESSGSAN